MYKLLILLWFTMTACAVSQNISHGITGKITWYEGDRMPGVNRPMNPGKPVRRTLYIYDLTNQREAVSRDGIFYSDLETRLIKKAKSDPSGNFSVSLPSGKYSVFVKEEQGLFANMLDGAGNINPVEVTEDSVTEMDIRVDYKAYY